MGVVYVAEHPLLKSKAAVKMLLPELSEHKERARSYKREASELEAHEQAQVVRETKTSG